MSKAMRERLEEIKGYLQEMGQLALIAIKDGMESLVQLDQELAARVIADDKKLDVLDETIEKACVRTIAQHQPVAADVRRLIVYLKVVTDLHRIGRYGYNIALLTQQMKGLQHFKRLIKLPEMSRVTLRMTEKALAGLLKDEADHLQELMKDDELVDAQMEELFREVITYTLEDPRRITVAMNYILAGRYLERAEDHAVSIGWLTHYMVTGRRTLNHTREKPTR